MTIFFQPHKKVSMKFLILFSLLSLNTFANEIIKVSDGSVAKCDNKVDVYRYRASLVYRPIDFTYADGKAQVKVEFLRCIQDGETFGFVEDKNIFQRTVVIEPGPFSRETMTIRIEREKFNVVGYRSDDTRLLTKGELQAGRNNKFTATLPIVLGDLQVNRNGDRYFEMTISSKMSMYDAATDRKIDARMDFMGTYRMIVK